MLAKLIVHKATNTRLRTLTNAKRRQTVNVVSAIDFGDLAANFNKGASGAAVGPGALSDPALVAFAEANGLMADVPEPASAGILAAATFATLARRRRRLGGRWG